MQIKGNPTVSLNIFQYLPNIDDLDKKTVYVHEQMMKKPIDMYSQPKEQPIKILYKATQTYNNLCKAY